MNEKKFTEIELLLRVPDFITVEEIVDICKSTTYNDVTMFQFPVLTYNLEHNTLWNDYNMWLCTPSEWGGFVVGFSIKDSSTYIKIRLIDVPNGRLITKLLDVECPIYVCPVGLKEDNKIIKLYAFRICSY
jgi:hypothetical protein